MEPLYRCEKKGKIVLHVGVTWRKSKEMVFILFRREKKKLCSCHGEMNNREKRGIESNLKGERWKERSFFFFFSSMTRQHASLSAAHVFFCASMTRQTCILGGPHGGVDNPNNREFQAPFTYSNKKKFQFRFTNPNIRKCNQSRMSKLWATPWMSNYSFMTTTLSY